MISSIGVLIVFGPQQLSTTLLSILYLAVVLLPVIGLNLIVGVMTLVFMEPESVINAFNSVVAAVSGFSYPLSPYPSSCRPSVRFSPTHIWWSLRGRY